MIKIFTDTSALYTPDEGKKQSITVFPLSVSINQQTYHEFVDIQTEEFYKQVVQGHIPSSSQPSIGMVMEAYQANPDDEIIHLCMADGLSGTYQSALSARSGVENNERIHVINSRTLCAPHRYMLDAIVQDVKNGLTVKEVLSHIEAMAATSCSFLIPQDFSFLKRGGRLTPLAATIGGALKLKPVMMQTADGTRLEKFTLARTMGKAIDNIIEELKKRGVDHTYSLGIAHAFALEQAEAIKLKIQAAFPAMKIDLFELTPAFITQGGPQCIAVQVIKC